MRHDLAGGGGPGDTWTWATPRPRYMRETEPLARPSSWPTPLPTHSTSPEIQAYRMTLLRRLAEGRGQIEPEVKFWAEGEGRPEMKR